MYDPVKCFREHSAAPPTFVAKNGGIWVPQRVKATTGLRK